MRAILSAILLACLVGCASTAPRLPGFPNERLLLGLGDRMTLMHEGRWTTLPERARALGLELDLAEVWLTRDWQDDWVTREQLQSLVDQGITPVVVHYFFGDDISVESVQRDRTAWFTSLWRLSRLVAIDGPVLVVLEPEWNVHAPPGETDVSSSPWFAEDLVNAANMIREQAPRALVGVCPGDFSPDRNLGTVLDGAAHALDFLAFQEMRASTDHLAGRTNYLSVGQAAVDYAGYLSGSFDLPVLLAYVAISSYGDWEQEQAQVIADLTRRRQDLLRNGVFGLVYFQLHDDPAHTGYFGAAEPHFGLLRADGTPKPAFRAYQRLQERVRDPTAAGR